MKEIFRDRARKTSDGSTNIDIKLKRFPKWRQGSIRYITAEDETTNFTRVMFGIADGDNIHWLADKTSPLAATKYWISDDIPIEQGEEIIVRFTGTTSGDALTVFTRGWMWPRQEA